MKKLFFINETDWVLSPTEEEAVRHYQDETGIEDVEVEEIPESEWTERLWTMDEYEDDGETPIVMTYAEYLEQFSENEILIVASTEW
jgi:hypothetical protein